MAVSENQIVDYERDGAVCLRGLFSGWVDRIIEGIERNMRDPGRFAAENLDSGEPGRFFDDYCNWQRIPVIEDIIRHSPAVPAAAALMRSRSVKVFHDHVLVKEPGTAKPTPWHQDAPYYFVDGMQNVSFWIPVDPVEETTLRVIAGSHRWEKMVLPIRWLNDDNFYPDADEFLPVPDPDSDPNRYRVLEWSMQPGDTVAFHYRMVHGARGNLTANRRRALSLRYLGDDARYITRPGRTSPPFPDHGMHDGEHLRTDWFPVVWPN